MMVKQTTPRIATKSLIALSTVLFVFSSCGNNNDKKDASINDLQEQEVVAEQPTTVENNSNEKLVEITLLSDDKMKFDKNEIRVKQGQTVKLTLKHTGAMPITAMGHNFVLLKSDVKLSEFGQAAAQSKLPDYNLPEELLDQTIAHTKMIGGGETVSIEFEAPEKGSYDFLCSFPGHHGIMKGKFIVE